MANRLTDLQARDYVLGKMTDFGHEGLEIKSCEKKVMEAGGFKFDFHKIVCQYEEDGEVYTAEWQVWFDAGNETIYGEW